MPSGRLCTIRLREQVPKTHGGCRFSRVNLATSEKFAFFLHFIKGLQAEELAIWYRRSGVLAALNLALQGRTVSRPSESLAVSGSVSRLLRHSIPPRESNAKRQDAASPGRLSTSAENFEIPFCIFRERRKTWHLIQEKRLLAALNLALQVGR